MRTPRPRATGHGWGSSSPVLCPVCARLFGSRAEMRDHYIPCRVELGRGGFWCEECDRDVHLRNRKTHVKTRGHRLNARRGGR